MTGHKPIEQQRFLTTNYNDELIVEEERVKTPEEFEYLEELLLTLDGINIYKMMSIDVKYPFVEYLVSRIKYENLVIARSKTKYMASNIRNYTVRATGDS
ncbi:MAG TPA: hypothetical protein PLW93_05515, partial [Candidatus Absconditabacterales bacterium]|nr:hypothetical protein [Candidatus Absconditabacterales bacterium]